MDLLRVKNSSKNSRVPMIFKQETKHVFLYSSGFVKKKKKDFSDHRSQPKIKTKTRIK